MRALVVDDHPLIHEIMPAVLRRAHGELAVSSEATLEGGLARAGAERPDLVLLDLGLPGCTGIDALARFRKRFPRLTLVVLSATSDRASILAALEAGAVGFIPKTSKPDVMVAALKVVAAGGVYVPPEALEEGETVGKATARRRRAQELDLTQRQKDVLRLILKGYSNEHIASELEIAPNTVKQHAHVVFAALGVSTRAEAVIAAARLGLTLG